MKNAYTITWHASDGSRPLAFADRADAVAWLSQMADDGVPVCATMPEGDTLSGVAVAGGRFALVTESKEAPDA
jgi:hypothetical protein